MPKTLNNVGFWTEERVELLRKHHAAGLSASQSAVLLGAPGRGAVMGKRARLGLTRPKPSAPKKAAKIAAAPRPKAPPKLKLVHSDVPRPPTPVKPSEPPGVHSRPWLERSAKQCAWPIGQGSDMLSCCAPVSRAGHVWQYCEDHLKRMFGRTG